MGMVGRKKKDGKVTPFSRELKRIMRDRDLSLTDVSKMADISKSTLSGWLASTATPADFTVVKRLANCLGVSMSLLCTGEEDKTAPKVGGDVIELFHNGESHEGCYRIILQKLVSKQS